MGIRFLPGSDGIYLKDVFRNVADLDTVSRNRSAKDKSEEIILNRAVFEVRDIYC